MPIEITQLSKYKDNIEKNILETLIDGYSRSIEFLKREYFLRFDYVRPIVFQEVLETLLKKKKIVLIKYTGNVNHYMLNDGFEYHDRKYMNTSFSNLPTDNELYE